MKLTILLTIAGACLFVTSCNTVAGAGRDMQKAGGAVTNAARDAAR